MAISSQDGDRNQIFPEAIICPALSGTSHEDRGRENMVDRPNRDIMVCRLQMGVTHVMSVSWTMNDDPAIENKSGI